MDIIPKQLSKTGKRYWKMLCPDVVKGGATAGRLQLLYLACDQLCQYEQCKRLVDKEGLIAMSERGVPKMHPALLVQRQAFMQAVAACKQLGLNAPTELPDDGPDEIDKLIGE